MSEASLLTNLLGRRVSFYRLKREQIETGEVFAVRQDGPALMVSIMTVGGVVEIHASHLTAFEPPATT